MPTMASGMEAEEETEHHLQRAIATETVSDEPTTDPLSLNINFSCRVEGDSFLLQRQKMLIITNHFINH